MAEGNPPRVVHSPSRHVYVDHIQPIGQFRERPSERTAEILNADWIARNAGEFDILHVHFQLREVAPVALQLALEELRKSGRSLAFTVHDLSDPQVEDQGEHVPQLAMLVDTADALFTLTAGAATRILEEFGRDAQVVPHPHVLPPELIGRRGRQRLGLPVVGLHLKSGRPGLAAAYAIQTLLALHDADSWSLRIDANFPALPALARREPDILQLLSAAQHAPGIDVRMHERFTDQEFFDYLSSISVAVLPYRLGSHSGWAEACLDAGAVVVAPNTTHIPDQHGSIVGFDLGSQQSLSTAISQALDLVGEEFWSAQGRLSQRESIATTLEQEYRRIRST